MLIQDYKVDMKLSSANGWNALFFTVMGSSGYSCLPSSSSDVSIDHRKDLASHVTIAY